MRRGCVRHGATGSWLLARSSPPGSSQLLQGDLNLAIMLPHVQQEGDMVAVMLNDVVVHVDQDSGREETWLDCGRPLAFRALSDKDDSDGYYISGTPVISSVSQTFSDPHNNLQGVGSLSHFQGRAQCPSGRATTQTRPASYHASDCAWVPLSTCEWDTCEQLKVDLGKTQCSLVASQTEDADTVCEFQCRRCGGWTAWRQQRATQMCRLSQRRGPHEPSPSPVPGS